MPLYMIERNFAEQFEVTRVSADKKKSYCLYEAANPEAIMEAARRAGVPADVIIAVDEVRPEAFV